MAFVFVHKNFESELSAQSTVRRVKIYMYKLSSILQMNDKWIYKANVRMLHMVKVSNKTSKFMAIK